MSKHDDDKLLDSLYEYDPLDDLSVKEKRELLAKFKEVFIDFDGDFHDFMNTQVLFDKGPNDLTSKVQDALTASKDVLDYKERLEKILADAENDLKEEGLANENSIGDFWLIYETRPYMSAKLEYLQSLLDLGMYKKAINQAEDMLRLNENDNLGIRYILINLYALMEDEEGINSLVEKFGDKEVEFLLGLSIYYFKVDNLRKSLTYLKKAQKTNKYVKEFIDGCLDPMMVYDKAIFHYSMGSLDQLISNYQSSYFLYTSLLEYYSWAKRKLRNIKK